MHFVIIFKPLSLFIFCCATSLSLFAQPSVVISNTSHLEYVEKNIYYFQDSVGKLSFNVISQLPDNTFTFQPQSDMSFGSTKAVWWFKMYAENNTAQDIFLLFQNHELMEVDCYVIDAVGKIDSMESGRMRSFEKSLFKINTPVFNIGKNPATIFLRIKATTMWLPLQAGTLVPIVSEIHHIDIISVLVIGIMVALAFYNLAFFFLLKDRLYLYYFAYVFFSVCLIIYNRGYLNEFLFSAYPNLKSITNLLNTGVAVFTILFTTKYLDTKKKAPILHRVLWFLLLITVLMRLIYFLPFQPWYNVFFQILFFMIMLYTLAVGIYIYIKGYKPAWFYILAFSLMYVGVFITILGFSGLISFNSFWVRNAYHTGAVLEAFILSFAMAYRFNLYKKEAHERELQLIKERSRIMADLHDDIGATLSSMSIYSDLAVNVMNTQPRETKKMIDKISDTSKELMNRMGDIIWSMKPVDGENNTMEGRLKNYASELLAPKNIFADFDINENLANSITEPESKKNLLLIVKEAFNNTAKYSGATKVNISLTANKENIILTIQDNGKGFSMQTIQTGNGLKNIQSRCLLLGGGCMIHAEPDKGVKITCTFPIAISSYIGKWK